MLVAGSIMLLIVAYDAFSTTLVTTTAAGPLTARIAKAMSALARRAATGPRSVLLQLAGPIVVLTTVGVWLLLLWGGWTLIFSASPDAVVSTGSRQTADGWARVYFAGFTTFTLGVGDYAPNGAVWQVLTSVAVISGLALTTMAITYLMPVVTAVTAQRMQANTIAGLGSTPQQIVLAGWWGGSFTYFDEHLPRLADGILLTAERHLSYPILHYFHSATREEDFRVQLFSLGEAMAILSAAVPASAGPHPTTLASVRHATEQLLQHVSPGSSPIQEPAAIDLEPLRDAGILTVDDATFEAGMDELVEYRRWLAAFAEESMWHPTPQG